MADTPKHPPGKVPVASKFWPHCDTILAFRAEGKTWKEIAAHLTGIGCPCGGAAVCKFAGRVQGIARETPGRPRNGIPRDEQIRRKQNERRAKCKRVSLRLSLDENKLVTALATSNPRGKKGWIIDLIEDTLDGNDAQGWPWKGIPAQEQALTFIIDIELPPDVFETLKNVSKIHPGGCRGWLTDLVRMTLHRKRRKP